MTKIFSIFNLANVIVIHYLIYQANSVTDLDSDEDKLNWIFMAFDQDGGGFIDPKEAHLSGSSR